MRLTGLQDLSSGAVSEVPALLQHSLPMPGAVRVQLLTCSYLETKGHCIDPPLAGVTFVFAVGRDSGEEDRGGIGA